ncbi:hypothetical protein EOA32_15205 [Mesorhizobium sp. M1A.F.Ca.ET.072.01.1.1]|uniref:hypothetical protein n=1 Tax=unclassified Mesorhizobium TaxID=325217 RepID=UPI000BAFAEED|nr:MULTISPECIES: hypothetical protein [unclassified Mesorhizobium]PBB39522.1 hypothetical protein CK221_01460 [Mesorhizobium sp. WSM3868]RUW51721.1 hypothetical protein EOA32_15205 [Mesorhizobium sp. M1A.F.Ca.ET.072.01.1.1]TIU95411.1 MAG: hypothetical protein E5W04_30920 [Mesorhizobium sp.]
MADGLVLRHREKTAQDADDQQYQSRVPKRLFGSRPAARNHHALRLVDGAPQRMWNEKLQRRGNESRGDGDRHLPSMAQRHAQMRSRVPRPSPKGCPPPA